MNIRNDILEPDAYYHIYNRGINSGKVFNIEENYMFFLLKLAIYLNPVCDIYAYCLMPNHFHLLIRVKNKEEIIDFAKGENKSFQDKNEKGLHAFDSIVSKQIGKLISSYTQSFNKTINRHGPLMESPFKRKRIDSEEYIRNLIVYIHLNPTDLKQNLEDYKFSSYKSFLSTAKTNLKREEVIALFGDLNNFIFTHKNPPKYHFGF
jgi:putative transposase